MRSEISNELLLQVIKAWDPDEADKWKTDDDLMWDCYFIRETDGYVSSHHEGDPWYEAGELVEFLLKDRPDLELRGGRCPRDTKEKSLESFDAFWDYNPWGPHTPPISIVNRIKSYEYLKEWKEDQESDIKLMTDGAIVRYFGDQEITGMPGTDLEILDDHLPVPYQTICPQCNGSKEVTGWLGKEQCQSCS